jgi:hypothetical protein
MAFSFNEAIKNNRFYGYTLLYDTQSTKISNPTNPAKIKGKFIPQINTDENAMNTDKKEIEKE